MGGEAAQPINRAKVAASAATPECSLAHNRGHSKECLTAQR